MLRIAQTFNTSDPQVHAALAAGDRGWVEQSLRRQIATGVDRVECNASSFGGDEETVLRWLVEVVEAAGAVPLSIDSANPDLLAAIAPGRRQPPLLNSVSAQPTWSAALLDCVRAGAGLVVQLRRGLELPHDTASRVAWAEVALRALRAAGVEPGQVLVDPVLLPWGSDLEAGAGLLGFLRESRTRWPEVGTVVGLSNVSYGHPDRRALHARWLPRLQDAGLTAVILDPFDATLMGLAR